jgi:hypothetical protein
VTPPGLRRIPLLAAAAFAALVARPVRAGDGGTLDVEIRNRSTVSGAISVPKELDTLRIRMPEAAELAVTVKGSGKVLPDVRVFGPDDAEIDVGPLTSIKGRTVKIVPFTPGAAGLYRIDVRATGSGTGNYALDASWRLPATETFAGQTASEGAFYVFDAEAGTKVDVLMRTDDPTASIRAVNIVGPRGYSSEFSAPARPSSVQRAKSAALPYTGRYEFHMATDVGGRDISGTLTRKASKKTTRVNLKGAEKQGKGVARTVSRIFDEDGGTVDVPRLDQQQRVSLDSSGLCLSVPAGGVALPAVFRMHTDDDAIHDPLGFSPAGVSVHFDTGGVALASSVNVTLPFDVGAFATGDVLSDICILRQEDDGSVFEMPRSSATVDSAAGVVTFPTSTFSSYQVFSPPVELAQIAFAGRPNDLAASPEQGVVYLSTDVLTSDLPAAAIMRYTPGVAFELFAGGGSSTGDGVDRLAYDFDADIGGSGAIVSALAVAPNGAILIVTGDVGRSRSLAYVIRTDGVVVRVAGDGTADLDESKPARETGLPFCCAAAFLPDGNVVVATDAFLYPESDRVLAIRAPTTDVADIVIGTVAGGGTADVSGFPPLGTRLLQPRAILVDSAGRILVGDRDWIVRFDLDAGTTTTLAGTNFGETDAGGGEGRTIGGVGAPLRTVVLGAVDDLAFVPGREDLLYVADPEAGIVWRMDLDRDRAFVAAGRRVDFQHRYTTRAPTPDAADPNQPLSFPVAVAPLGDEVFIAERFDDTLFSLRRVNR